jgi:hypothetical protein
MLYKTINHHLPRPVAKRAAAVALLNSIGGVSNIWSSYLWFAGPRYFAAFGFRKSSFSLFLLLFSVLSPFSLSPLSLFPLSSLSLSPLLSDLSPRIRQKLIQKVLGNAALFVIAITGYKFWVLNENKKLDKGGEAAESTKRYGVTDQQIKLGWRYEGY